MSFLIKQQGPYFNSCPLCHMFLNELRRNCMRACCLATGNTDIIRANQYGGARARARA